MSNVRTITADFATGEIIYPNYTNHLAYQYDDNSNTVVFVNVPTDVTYTLYVTLDSTDYYITLDSAEWTIPVFFTEDAQEITFQLCCTADDYERHSPEFAGRIIASKTHDATEYTGD